jgi:hypothetical protein
MCGGVARVAVGCNLVYAIALRVPLQLVGEAGHHVAVDLRRNRRRASAFSRAAFTPCTKCVSQHRKGASEQPKAFARAGRCRGTTYCLKGIFPTTVPASTRRDAALAAHAQRQLWRRELERKGEGRRGVNDGSRGLPSPRDDQRLLLLSCFLFGCFLLSPFLGCHYKSPLKLT